MPECHQEARQHRNGPEEQRSNDSDTTQEVSKVTLSWGTRTNSRDEPTLLSNDVSLLVGFKCDVDVEERKGHNQEEVERDIDETRWGERVRNERLKPRPRNHVGQQDRDIED